MENIKAIELNENEAAEVTGGVYNPALNGQNPFVTVQPGDTISSIARNHNISIDELCRLNMLRGTDIIHPGQILRLWK